MNLKMNFIRITLRIIGITYLGHILGSILIPTHAHLISYVFLVIALYSVRSHIKEKLPEERIQ